MTYKVDRKKMWFWTLHSSYWGSYWLFICIIHAFARVFEIKLLLWSGLIAFIGFSLSLLIRAVYKRIRFNQISLPLLLLIILSITLIAANLWYGIDLLLDHLLKSSTEEVAEISLKNYLTFTFYWEILLFGWSALYFFTKFWMTWHSQKKRSEMADHLAKKSQLQMLRYQLNPHFLFNALNSVRALIEENEDQAQVMITELSEFLRYSLMNEDHEDIPLKHEIDALKHYFSIEKKRYEDKLDVAFEIQPEAENYPVISFLIHPLAENALKYGMKTSSMPLQIRVRAKVQNNHLKVAVCNTGNWLTSEENGFKHLSTGTGLENVRKRLENAFPRHYQLNVVNDNQTVTVLMDIYKN